MARLVAAFGSSHSPMLAARAEDWNGGFLGRDRTRAHVDLDGNPCDYDDVAGQCAGRRAGTDRAGTAGAAACGGAGGDRAAGGDVAAAKLDALIVVGDDQEELFDQSNMPAIGIYYGETIRNAGQARSRATTGWRGRAAATWSQRRRSNIRAIPCWRGT